MTNTPLPRPVDVQQPSTSLTPSLIRTLFPFLAGLIGTWLVDRAGVDVDSNTLTAVLVAVIGYLYYVIARFAEVYVSDKVGYVLGFRKTPLYADVPSTVVAVDQGDPRADEGGYATLGLAGVVIGILGFLGLCYALIADRGGFIVPSALAMGAGVVLIVLDGLAAGRRR